MSALTSFWSRRLYSFVNICLIAILGCLTTSLVSCNKGNSNSNNAPDRFMVTDVPAPTNTCLNPEVNGYTPIQPGIYSNPAAPGEPHDQDAIWQHYRRYRIEPYPWTGANRQDRRQDSRRDRARDEEEPSHVGGHRFKHPIAAPFPGYDSPRFVSSFCSCPTGTIPACSNSLGLTCLPSGGPRIQYVIWHYRNGSFVHGGFGHPYGRHGQRYESYDRGSASICAQSVAQICYQVGQSLGAAYCQAITPGSPYGVWVRRF